jgi:hypothetical protein
MASEPFGGFRVVYGGFQVLMGVYVYMGDFIMVACIWGIL